MGNTLHDLTEWYKKGRFLSLIILLFCTMGSLQAQNVVTGVVKDPTGLTIPGVNVSVKGGTGGVATNVDGEYSITAPANATLVFSFIGFASQEIAIQNKKQVNVTLTENSEVLDEVVVIGYGTQKKSDVNSSISSVKASDIQDLKQVSIDQMLQGKAAGVTITNNSGQPGSQVSVKIRGNTSISGTNEPLYVIDGIPVSGDGLNKATTGRPVGGGNFSNAGSVAFSPLSAINPNDIESVDILKDASATAIYGSRGANGVVIITTKSGKKGTGKLTYDNSYSIQTQSRLLDAMNLRQYAALQNELAKVYGVAPRAEFSNPSLLGNGTDWQDEIYKNAIMQQHQLSFSGGKEGINYYLSGSYTDQAGTVIGSGFKRYTFKTNLDAKLKDWLKAGVYINGGVTNEDITLNGQQNGIISTSLLSTPDTAVRNLDGTFAGPPADGTLGSFINPVAAALQKKNKLIRKSFSANFFTEAKLLKGLEYRFEIGGYADFSNNKEFNPTYAWGSAINAFATLDQRTQESYSMNIKNLLTYKTSADKHNFTILAGQEANDSHWQGLSVQGRGFLSNDLQELSVSAAKDFTYQGQFKGSQALYSFFGRLIYDFDNRYSVTASMRADGSSKFSEGNKWGYFPAVSGSWKLSEEAFMESTRKYISDIRFRIGYGETGNQQIPNYLYGSAINSAITGIGQGFLVSNFSNPNLQWETSKQTNLGLDFSLFNSKLTTTIEVYKKISSKFLIQAPLPLFLTGGDSYEGGMAPPYVNAGEMQNTGIDLTLNYKNTFANGLSWNSTLVVSRYKNRVNEISSGLEIPQTINFNDFTSSTVTNTSTGNPIGMFYGLKSDGIIRNQEQLDAAPLIGFSNTIQTSQLGDVLYVDQNGDGIIDDKDITTIGNPHPDFTFGFTNSFAYKGLDLSIFLQGSVGNDIMNLTRRAGTLNANLYVNQLADAADFWTADNVNASLPRPVGALSHQNLNVSDRFIEDGSYMRLQNLTLGYSFPTEILSQLKITRLRIYTSIQNLYTLTNYKGYDPEVGSFNQNVLLSGVDNGRYPTPRTFSMGLNVEF